MELDVCLPFVSLVVIREIVSCPPVFRRCLSCDQLYPVVPRRISLVKFSYPPPRPPDRKTAQDSLPPQPILPMSVPILALAGRGSGDCRGNIATHLIVSLQTGRRGSLESEDSLHSFLSSARNTLPLRQPSPTPMPSKKVCLWRNCFAVHTCVFFPSKSSYLRSSRCFISKQSLFEEMKPRQSFTVLPCLIPPMYVEEGMRGGHVAQLFVAASFLTPSFALGPHSSLMAGYSPLLVSSSPRMCGAAMAPTVAVTTRL